MSMDAVKFLEERSRMCGKLHCYECPLYWHNKQDNIMECHILSEDNAAQSVAVVEKWSEEHPRKTRQSEFLERWPAARLDERGVLAILPCLMDTIRYGGLGDTCVRGMSCTDCRKEYWGKEEVD